MIFIFLFTVDVYANMYNKAEAEFRNGNITNSLKIFKQSCKKKNANNCGILGDIYIKKAMHFNKKACTGGDKDCCRYYKQLQKI